MPSHSMPHRADVGTAGDTPPPPAARLRVRAARARRWAARHRRLLAAAFAAGCVASTIVALRPPGSTPVPVLVAGRDLPAGATLRGGDLSTAALPASALPAGVLRADGPRPIGRRLVGAMRRGEPFTDAAFGASGAASRFALTPGTVAAPVPIAHAAAARLLRPGDRIDVLAANGPGGDPTGDPGGGPGGAGGIGGDAADGSRGGAGEYAPARPGGMARVVAAGVVVRGIARRGGGDAFDSSQGALIVVEAAHAQARALAAAAAGYRLSFVINGSVPGSDRER